MLGDKYDVGEVKGGFWGEKRNEDGEWGGEWDRWN